MSNEIIGVAGCGAMGLPMAERLLEAGFDVRGFDVRPAQEFAPFGGRMITDPREFARHCDIVLSVVRDARQTMDLCFDNQAVFSGPDKPTTLVLCSTLAPRVVHECRERLPAHIELMDAPMSGAPYRARLGTLSFMLGGDRTLRERLMPMFEAMGGDIFELGALGSGMTAKVLNNYCAAASVVATHRVLAFARALGLERRALLNVMAKSSGSNWFADHIDQIDWSGEGYAPDNTIAIIEKDVLSALDVIEKGDGVDRAALDDAILSSLRNLDPLDL